MRKTIIFKVLIFLLVLFPAVDLAAYNLDSLMNIVELKYAEVKDYTCKLSKIELIEGDYVSWNNVIYKHRKPDNYYMKWTDGMMDGSEIIYAGKKYKNKLTGHLGGILNIKNFDLDPNSPLVKKMSRHSILESDLGFTIQLMRRNLQKAKSLGVGKIDYIKDMTFNNRRVNLFKAEFPANKGFYGHSIFIYLDKLLVLPVKFEVYDWQNTLIESYTFSNLKINVGLKEIDFDTKNKSYNY